MIKEKFAAEYSRSQDCFHVQPLSESLLCGMNQAAERINNDYVIFFIGDHKTCSEKIRSVVKYWYEKGIKNDHTEFYFGNKETT